MKIRGQEILDPKNRIRSHAIISSGGCWEWTGGRSKESGYGRICVGSRRSTRRTMAAHRYSYLTFVGEIPNGLNVCHRCDNPCCVNPDHLFLGTQSDNVKDAVSKGRVKPPHTNRIFTAEKVMEIRNRFVPRVITRQMLADEYGVSIGTIKRVVCERLPPAPEVTP